MVYKTLSSPANLFQLDSIIFESSSGFILSKWPIKNLNINTNLDPIFYILHCHYKWYTVY